MYSMQTGSRNEMVNGCTVDLGEKTILYHILDDTVGWHTAQGATLYCTYLNLPFIKDLKSYRRIPVVHH